MAKRTLARRRRPSRTEETVAEPAGTETPAPPPRPAPAEIAVVDCCGVFGWLIPWPLWKCRRLPLVATRDFSRRYVYLYSIVGQLGHCPGAVIPREERPETPALLLDRFVDWDSKLVDWQRVAAEIERLGTASQA